MCMGHMMIYLLGCTRTFMILSWGTFLTYNWKGAIQAMGFGYCLVSILGATSGRGYWVNTREGDCNQSRAAKRMVVHIWKFLGILEIQVWQLSTNFKELYRSKKGWKFRKGFQKMEVKIICANFVLMDFINPFGVSGDVTRYINMQISTYIYFGNTQF